MSESDLLRLVSTGPWAALPQFRGRAARGRNLGARPVRKQEQAGPHSTQMHLLRRSSGTCAKQERQCGTGRCTAHVRGQHSLASSAKGPRFLPPCFLAKMLLTLNPKSPVAHPACGGL